MSSIGWPPHSSVQGNTTKRCSYKGKRCACVRAILRLPNNCTNSHGKSKRKRTLDLRINEYQERFGDSNQQLAETAGLRIRFLPERSFFPTTISVYFAPSYSTVIRRCFARIIQKALLWGARGQAT